MIAAAMPKQTVTKQVACDFFCTQNHDWRFSRASHTQIQFSARFPISAILHTKSMIFQLNPNSRDFASNVDWSIALPFKGFIVKVNAIRGSWGQPGNDLKLVWSTKPKM